MRLIDADDAKRTYTKDMFDTEEDFERVNDVLNYAPTVDAVSVVRCKDCKWFADNNGGEWYGCKMFQVVWINPDDEPKPNDFCSYVKRRDGGNGDVSG